MAPGPPARRGRRRWRHDKAMNRFIVPIYFALAVAVSFVMWFNLPKLSDLGKNMFEAGPLVAMLFLLFILQVTFVLERTWSLNKAKGRGSLPEFLNNVRKKIHDKDVDGAIKLCGQQRGSAANVMRAGLERYNKLMAEGAPKDKIVAET